jgi:cardiolipin synthase (CMP-forming)
MSGLRRGAALRSGCWSTRANALSLLRLLAAPALAASIARQAWLSASLLFALASASDFADGRVARRYGEASRLGRLIDHAVDACFVAFGTAALAWQGLLPAALPALIALAFAQYALDSRAAGSGGLRPNRLGRWNGIAYYVSVAVPLARELLGLAWPTRAGLRLAGWALVASTLLSMLLRLRVSRAQRRATAWHGARRRRQNLRRANPGRSAASPPSRCDRAD